MLVCRCRRVSASCSRHRVNGEAISSGICCENVGPSTWLDNIYDHFKDDVASRDVNVNTYPRCPSGI